MASKKKPVTILPIEVVQQRIFILRSQRVILSHDLSDLYGVTAKALNQAARRNAERFPDDFMFQLTPVEFRNLKSQLASARAGSADRSLRSQSVTLKPDLRGSHLKYRPYAFTEQGVAMLSAVLRSPTAVRESIEIVRAFVRLRQLLSSHEDLRHKLESLERRLYDHDDRFTLVFDADGGAGRSAASSNRLSHGNTGPKNRPGAKVISRWPPLFRVAAAGPLNFFAS